MDAPCRELLKESLVKLQADAQEKAEALKAEGGDPTAVFVRYVNLRHKQGVGRQPPVLPS